MLPIIYWETEQAVGCPNLPSLLFLFFVLITPLLLLVVALLQLAALTMTDSSEPLDHFETLPTSYEALHGVHTTIWLPTHDKVFVQDTIREYKLMRSQALSDSEFVAYALENLLLRDPRHPEYEQTGWWRVDRALKLAVQVSSRWRLPPAPRDPGQD